MTTIRDVAKYANVSAATVSRVLNKKGYVSKEAEEAVVKAIEKLNFQPNAVARTLYSKSSRMIGLILPDITNPYFPELARAIEDVALSNGYTVVLCNTDDDEKKEKQYIEALKQKYVDGIILVTNQLDVTDLAPMAVPIIALDRILSEDIPAVVSENENGAIVATEHLIDCGCKFIAHLRGPIGLTSAEDRLRGFQSVVQQKGIANIVVNSDFNFEKSEEVTMQLLKKYPTIDGIFTSSDITAAGAMKAAHTLGRTIPDNLQIIGFDGIPLGKMLAPSLTTIEQPIYEMGALGARLLIQQFENKTLDTNLYKLPTKLVVRGTTKMRGEKA
nr:LacI family DNA-binding transcriptional regulator [Anaerobacillus alkalilacustris]